MAPIKFEEHIKEKLDKREIQPSAGSWDKLNSRLDAGESRSGSKWWYSAAAAVMVLLIASVLFVNQQKQTSNPLVETPVEEKIPENRENIDFKQPIQTASEENKEVKNERSLRPQTDMNVTEQIDEQIAEKQNSENVLKSDQVHQASQAKREYIEPIEFRTAGIAENEPGELYNKVQEVLAKISQGEKRTEEYTAAEVDALLAQAASEISKSKIVDIQGGVSADVLLADVEYEVDQSFRKEVFDFLKEEFLKAKTAVATRND